MQSRVLSSDEGKDSTTIIKTTQSRVLPLRVLRFFLVFLVLALGLSVLSMYMIRYFGVQNIITAAQLNSQPCLEEPSTLEQWIKPPSNLRHKMNDEELIWRASFVPQLKKYPFERVPKIAFMFLTRGPLPLSPLWERFLKGHERFYSIYIHSLPSYHAEFPPASVFYKRQIPSQVAEWGQTNMVDAERRLLANALLDISNEWFVLLSESCIPLYNFNFIYQYIKGSQYSFIGVFDDPGPFGRGRYTTKMLPEVSLSQWRKGSQWFEVNRRLAVNIVEDTKYYPKFKEFCRGTCYIDEHYIPTMLSIESGHLLANRSISWVDWSRGGSHPGTFGKSDITGEFLKRIRDGGRCTYNNHSSTSCSLFARKFSPSALQPLLRFSKNILGY